MYQWKEKGQCSKETNVVSGMRVTDRAKADTKKPHHPLRHSLQKHEVEVCREKEMPEAEVQSEKFNRPPCEYFLKGTCTKLPCEYWHPPECQFYNSESGCKFGAECSFAHRQVEDQPNKKPKTGGDKSAAAIVKSVRQLSCDTQDDEPPDSATISTRGTKVLEPIRRVRFTRAALRQANIRENKGPSLWKNTSQNSSSAKPIRYEV